MDNELIEAVLAWHGERISTLEALRADLSTGNNMFVANIVFAQIHGGEDIMDLLGINYSANYPEQGEYDPDYSDHMHEWATDDREVRSHNERPADE